MGKILCIPDVHQGINWAKKILEKEADAADRIIFLGDFFDIKNPWGDISTPVEVCRFMEEIRVKYKGRIDVLHSNHDLQYYYMHSLEKYTHNPFLCSSFNRETAAVVCENLSKDFINECQFAVMHDGIVYSHAGVMPDFFFHKGKVDVEEFFNDIKSLNQNWRTDVDNLLLGCGAVRKGPNEFGGLTWCDFDREFRADFHLPPQMFGHTRQTEPKRKMHNWCVDCIQTFYAVVEDGNKIYFKSEIDSFEETFGLTIKEMNDMVQ